MFAGTKQRPRGNVEMLTACAAHRHGFFVRALAFSSCYLSKWRTPCRVSCICLDVSRVVQRSEPTASVWEIPNGIDGADRWNDAIACPGTSKIEKRFIGETGKSIWRIFGASRAIAKRIVVILSFAAASIPLWPTNLLLLRTGFTSARLSGFIAARLFFSIADARVRTVRLISFALRRRHVRRMDRGSRNGETTFTSQLKY